MVIKIVFYILTYLCLGTLTLAIMLWHDRKCKCWIDKWVEGEISLESIVVLLFPAFWVVGIGYFLFLIFPVKFAHFIMTIPTTIVYVIKALKENIDGKNNNV